MRLYVISCLTVLAAVLSSTLLFLEKCLHHRASLAKWFDRRFSDSDSLQQWGNMANEDRIGRVGGGGANGRCVCVCMCVCVRARACHTTLHVATSCRYPRQQCGESRVHLVLATLPTPLRHLRLGVTA